MRHFVRKKQLHRPKAHRVSLIKNLLNQLFVHEKIKTGEIKAKVLRQHAERIITMVKKKSGSPFSMVRYLKQQGIQKPASQKLFSKIIPGFKDRSSGFIKITSLKFRKGDNAKIVQIELTK